MFEIAEFGEKALSAASAKTWWRAIDFAMRFARAVKEFEVWSSQQRSGSHAGKAKARRYVDRDLKLALEYKQQEAANKRLPGSALRSSTAMKVAIGKREGLKRSAAVAAINRGLESLEKTSSLQRKPDDR
jgi:hypothetical protein